MRPRAVLGLVLACDLLLCAAWVGRPALYAVAAVGVAAALWFAFRGALAGGLVALACGALLVEAQAVHVGGSMRFLFFSGTCLLGWLLGLAFGRDFGLPGARAALAAAYLGALAEKLGHEGLRWTGGVRAVLAAQHVWGHSRVLDAATLSILDHAWLARLLGGFTLAAQASAILLPFSRRGRLVSCALLLTFHAGVWLLTPIAFPQAMVLLVALCWPTVEAEPVIKLRGVAAVASLVVMAWLPPVRALARHLHAPPAQPASAASRARLHGLAEGVLVGGLRVERIEEPEPGVIRVALGAGGEWLAVELVPRGTRPLRPPRSTATYDLFVDGNALPRERRDAILDALAALLHD